MREMVRSDVNSLFEEKFSSRGKASSVKPISIEHYKVALNPNFPISNTRMSFCNVGF